MAWGNDPDGQEQRRRFEEEAMEWARLRLVNEARGRGQSSSQINLVMGMVAGGGAAFDVTTTTTVEETTTTTTSAPEETTTTTTEEPATTTTTTEDPNWVELVFSDWSWVETTIGARGTLANWTNSIVSSFLSNFTSLAVNEGSYSVRLYGGAGIATTADCFNESNIVSVTDNGNAIFELGSGSFELCSSLTSVTLQALTSAGNIAFKDCTGLTSINLPSLSSAGNSCFEGCTNITTFSLASVSTVGDRCFKGCTAATSFDLSSLSALGTGSNSYTGTDEVFSGITGNTVSITMNTVPATATGAYDEDLLYLFDNNTVTLNSQDPMWVTVDSAAWTVVPKAELSASGTAYGDGSPTASALGFVASQSQWPTLSDTVFTAEEILPGVFTATVPDLANGTWYARAYVTYGLGTFYSPTQIEVTVVPVAFTFSRRTTTDVSDPPNYINGEPIAAQGLGQGIVYFDLSLDGNTGSIIDSGIISSTTSSPTSADNPQPFAPGQGLEYYMPAEQRYFRAYATQDGTNYFYSDSPGIQFRMEEILIDDIGVTPISGPPTYEVQLDFSAQLINPVGTVSNVGFSWKIKPVFDVTEPDPYYSPTDSISLSPPSSPFTFTHSITDSSPDSQQLCYVRAWAVIDGIKYWSGMLSVSY